MEEQEKHLPERRDLRDYMNVPIHSDEVELLTIEGREVEMIVTIKENMRGIPMFTATGSNGAISVEAEHYQKMKELFIERYADWLYAEKHGVHALLVKHRRGHTPESFRKKRFKEDRRV